MTDEVLTLKEIAKYLKLAEKTTSKLAAVDKIADFKVRGSWLFKQSDIESWITGQKNKKGTK